MKYLVDLNNLPFLDEEPHNIDIDKPLKKLRLSLTDIVFPVEHHLILDVVTTVSINVDGEIVPLNIKEGDREASVNLDYPFVIHEEAGTEAVLINGTTVVFESDSTIRQALTYNSWIPDIVDELMLEEGQYTTEEYAYITGGKQQVLKACRNLIITDPKSLKPYIDLRPDIFNKNIFDRKKFKDIDLSYVSPEALFPLLKDLDLLGQPEKTN